MKTPAQVEALRLQHETAVWAAIQSSGEGNPPSSAAGAATAAAMQTERAAAANFARNPSAGAEADFDGAARNTAARFLTWKGRAIGGTTPAALTTSTSTAATSAGIGLPVLAIAGLAAWWYFKKKGKGGKGKKKFLGLFSLLLALMVFAPACQAVGPSIKQDATGVKLATGVPNTLTLTDSDGQWTSNGVGPAQWTDLTAEGVQTFRQGSTPREIFWDGNTHRLVVSSGSDITAEGVTVDPVAGMLQVQRFTTTASEPIRAQNEAFAALVGYWSTLTQEQRAAHIADVEAAQAAGDTFAPVLLQLIRAAAGVP